MDEMATDTFGDDEDVQALYANSLGLLRLAQTALTDQVTQLRCGETVQLADLIKAQKELATMFDMALKMEQRLDEWTRHRDGNGDESRSDGDLDLEAARYEIGCRLDRLRACCRSE